MSVQHILELMPKPEDVVETKGHDWIRMEAEIGFKFPSDYKAFLGEYGTGSIANCLWIFNPFSQNPNLNVQAIRAFWDAYRFMKDRFPADYPRDIESFFPWASTDSGESIFWEADDKNSIKRIGVHPREQTEEEFFELTTSDFIHELLTGRLKSNILPVDYIKDNPTFEPAKISL